MRRQSLKVFIMLIKEFLVHDRMIYVFFHDRSGVSRSLEQFQNTERERDRETERDRERERERRVEREREGEGFISVFIYYFTTGDSALFYVIQREEKREREGGGGKRTGERGRERKREIEYYIRKRKGSVTFFYH